MNMKVLAVSLLYSWGLLFPLPVTDALDYLNALNKVLIRVAEAPPGSRDQGFAMDTAKILIKEALIDRQINTCSSLYAIGGIILNDPVWAARAVELEKQQSHGRQTTVTLERHHANMEMYGETQIDDLDVRIGRVNKMLEDTALSWSDRQGFENILLNLKNTKRWMQARCIAHGALKKSIEMYKSSREKEK